MTVKENPRLIFCQNLAKNYVLKYGGLTLVAYQKKI